MTVKKLILIVACFAITACSTFKIYQPDKEKPSKGIPFYSQKQMIEQTTVITRSWVNVVVNYDLLIDGKINEAAGQKFALRLNIHEYNLDDFKKKLDEVREGLPDPKDCFKGNCIVSAMIEFENELIKTGKAITECDFLGESSINSSAQSTHLNQQIISNTYESKVTVDYENKYYFNSKVYPFSTTNTKFTLAKDGTLTEASNDVDTTELADLIPLKEFLTDKLNIGEKAALPDPDINANKVLDNNKLFAIQGTVDKAQKNNKKAQHEFTVKADVKSYIYTLKKQHDAAFCNNKLNTDKNGNCPILEMGGSTTSVTRSSSDQAKTPKKEDDDKSYQFSGKFTPPKGG